MKKFINKITRQVIVLTLMASVLMPHVANAQLAVTAPILEAQTITDYIGRLLKVTFRNVAVVGAVNVSQQIARDAAESIATWIVKGAPGQNPLAYMKSPGDYVKDHTEQALGGILDQMSEDFANASLLCVANPLAPLGVLAGLYDALNSAANISPFNNKGQNITGLSTGTLGKCDVGSITVSYKSLMNELSSEQLLDRFNNALIGGGSEVSSIVQAQMQALASLVREQNNAELERIATKTHADLKSPISGDVLRPSSEVETDAELNSVKFQMEQESRMLGGVLASGAEAIPAIFATTLANSLSKKLIARLKQGKGTIPTAKEINLANIFGAGKSVSSGTMGSLYTDVKTAVITESELDLLTSFAACPDKFAQPDNCVLDSKFESAIRAASAGKPLTVREAIEQGKLDANWELVPASQTARNEDRLCFKSAYCHSNLMKLRKARIIPIGWEIAASLADGTGKVTLGAVVSGFNNCAYNDGEAVRDSSHPYCHLIDPNWVLKMPEQVCRAKVYGPLPENEMSGNRQEVCADQASCLEEDANGQCTGAYGYCLKERNTFRFDAESCPAQFAGCRTFNNRQFGQISLIESTVSSAVCNEKNAGCLGYSVDYLPDGNFDKNAPKVYLNGKAEQCEAQYAGCSEVQNATTGQTQFVRIAPPSLGCQGLSTDPVQCQQYAKACTADEVGCEMYQPVGSADPQIPGVATFASKNANGQIVDWNDECSAECVGYTSYYQAPTQIEPVPASAVAFIPKTAKSCTQDMVGCNVFVNVDTAAKGGGSTSYFSQIQKCTDPEIEKNHAIFYSWEGSDQSGYQLRQHDLTLAATGGAPVYDAPTSELSELDSLCNADVYKTRVDANGKPDPNFDSDCRELFDTAGTAFYRLMSRTIVSSASCTAFRAEDVTEANCNASRGIFDAATGSCQYNALPSGSTSCKEEFVGCRAYNGAAALSPKKILDEEFNSVANWTGGELSSEGITVGDTVLRIPGNSASAELPITQNKTYSISFWAKGVGSVDVSFVTAKASPATITLNSAPLAVSAEWKQFQVSTAVAPWTDVAAKIEFKKTSGSGLIYIENLVVKEQADIQYVIKDSWETPLMCDPNPNDTLPGPALNCQEYKPTSDSKKTNVYLTGFTGLCRPAVAGCQKFVNTYNTAQVTEYEAKFGSVKRTVPADDFVYAVATSAAFCPADKKGCTAVGVTVDGKTETSYRMYNPDNHATIACQQEEEWCQAFDVAGVNGQQRYFKFPDKSSRCEYKENKEVAGVLKSGWFKEGTSEPCYANFVSGGNTYGIYKNGDDGYKGMTALCQPEFNQCTEFVDRADISKDYPAGRPYFFMKDARLDTQSCNGKVSLKEGCVAIDDTSDGNKTISTLATYCKSDAGTDPLCDAVLSAANVSADTRAKDGALVAPVNGVSSLDTSKSDGISCGIARENGLFAATDCDAQLSRLKAAGLTSNWVCPANAKSIADKIAEVQTACSQISDANTIVKVRRDRTCSEWLACQSSISVFDKNTQKYKEVCTDLGVCNQLSKDSGAVGRCANWITDAQLSDEEKLARALPLSTDRYTGRNVGWYGQEFSGYSLWNKFQPDKAGLFARSTTIKDDQVMGVGFASQSCLSNTANGATCVADVFSSDATKEMIEKKYGEVSFEGNCFEQKCWYPIEGFAKTGTITQSITYTPPSCRGYAEADAPFPVEVILETNFFGLPKSKAAGYTQVNVCDVNRLVRPSRTPDTWKGIAEFADIRGASSVFSIPNASCECSYKKVAYGSNAGIGENTRYFSTKASSLADTSQIGASVLIRPNSGSVWTPATVVGISSDLKTYKVKITKGGNGYTEGNEVSKNESDVAFFVPKAEYKTGDKIVASSFEVSIFEEVTILKDFRAVFPSLGSTKSTDEAVIADTVAILNSTGYSSSYLTNSSLSQLDANKYGACPNTYAISTVEGFDGVRAISIPCLEAISKRDCNVTNTGAFYKGVFGGGSDNQCKDLQTTIKTMKDLKSKLGAGIALDDSRSINMARAAMTVPMIRQKEASSGSLTAVPDGICSGGWFVEGSKIGEKVTTHSKKGMACSTDFDCIDERVLQYNKVITEGKDGSNTTSADYHYSNDDGRCEFKTQETTVLGWEGYCLEEDFRTHINGSPTKRACLTWLPTDVAALDVYNQYKDAAYAPLPSGEGRYYCTESEGRMKKGLPRSQAFTYTPKEGDNNYLSFSDTDDSVTHKYKDYFNGLTDIPTSFNADELDYVELVSKGGADSMFGEGFTVRIARDGAVRVYSALTNTEYCQVEKSVDSSTGKVFTRNMLNPDPASLEEEGFLEALSAQVRCEKGTDNCPGMYKASSGSKPTADQFICKPGGETKVEKASGDPAVAVTGVAINGNAVNYNKAASMGGAGAVVDYVPQISNGTYREIWFARFDNGTGFWNDDKEIHERQFGVSALAHDIIRSNVAGKRSISPTSQAHVELGSGNCAPSEQYNSDSTYSQKAATLRVLFGPDGRFVGIDTGSCQLSKVNDLVSNWQINFHFRDMCKVVSQVVDVDGNNKAATNRLWSGFPKGTEYEHSESNPIKVYPGATTEQDVTKIGSIAKNNVFGSFLLNRKPVELMYAYIELTSRTGPSFSQAIGSKDVRSYSCENGDETCLANAAQTALNVKVPKVSGENALTALFARVYTTYTYSATTRTYIESSSSLDKSAASIGNAPTIFAFDPTTCAGARGATCLLKQKNAFTINGVFEQDAAVFGKRSLAATLQFYGSADQNHMPIKRIVVDWGDGKQLEKEGMYRNHKPVCSSTSKPAAVCKFGAPDYNHTCSTSKDCVTDAGNVAGVCTNSPSDLKWSFGSWPGNGASDEGACEEGYFQYSHAYTFTSDCGGVGGGTPEVGTTESITKYGLQGQVGIGERFCVFKPRVQLMDNWDVCNGEGKGVGGVDEDGILVCNSTPNKGAQFQGFVIVKE